MPSSSTNGPPLSPRSIVARSSEDVAVDPRLAIDIATGRPVGAGHGRRHDRQRAATRVAERRPDGAALVPRGEAQRLPLQVGRPEERDVECRIEQDHVRIGPVAANCRDVDGTIARAGHNVGVRHHVALADDGARARRLCATDPSSDPDRACLGRPGDPPGGRIRGRVDGRSRERLETDEDVRQARVVQQAGEDASDLGRRGRTALRVLTADDVWAASLSRARGPRASSPPASQMTRSACAAR